MPYIFFCNPDSFRKKVSPVINEFAFFTYPESCDMLSSLKPIIDTNAAK